jgi:hypothetical protein
MFSVAKSVNYFLLGSANPRQGCGTNLIKVIAYISAPLQYTPNFVEMHQRGMEMKEQVLI